MNLGESQFIWAQALLLLTANMLGFSIEASFYSVLSTTVGQLAHANISWKAGPLNYLINTPELHTWHHVHPDYGPQDRNFGVAFSLWDWLFRTAYLPDHPPVRLSLKATN